MTKLLRPAAVSAPDQPNYWPVAIEPETGKVVYRAKPWKGAPQAHKNKRVNGTIFFFFMLDINIY